MIIYQINNLDFHLNITLQQIYRCLINPIERLFSCLMIPFSQINIKDTRHLHFHILGNAAVKRNQNYLACYSTLIPPPDAPMIWKSGLDLEFQYHSTSHSHSSEFPRTMISLDTSSVVLTPETFVKF